MRSYPLFPLAVLLAATIAVSFSQTMIEGRVTLPLKHATPVMNKRYQIITEGGVLSTNPPLAVVYLEGSFPKPLSTTVVEMAQKDMAFVPTLLPVQVGTRVDFPNFDPIFHNAFSNFSGQPFDVGLYPPGAKQSVVFRTAGIVRVFCHIHSTMSAVIAVLPAPWYTLTPESGRFAIGGVPPGEYDLHLFHERALPDNLKFLEHRIVVPESGVTLPLISISETGFLPAPHLDKYGKPYPPQSSGGVYKGAR